MTHNMYKDPLETTKASLHILIIGSGVGGLCLAQGLKKYGMSRVVGSDGVAMTGKLGQTSTNFKVKRGKSAPKIGIDTSSSTQHRFRPGIPPSMSCKLVSSVTLFAGSRVIERVAFSTRAFCFFQHYRLSLALLE